VPVELFEVLILLAAYESTCRCGRQHTTHNRTRQRLIDFLLAAYTTTRGAQHETHGNAVPHAVGEVNVGTLFTPQRSATWIPARCAAPPSLTFMTLSPFPGVSSTLTSIPNLAGSKNLPREHPAAGSTSEPAAVCSMRYRQHAGPGGR
jgi:hypothetical protein